MRAVARWWALESALGAGLVAGLLALVAWWGVSDKAQSDKVTHFLINVVLVLALQLFSGNTGILSFGQMAFVGTGAYVAAILTLDPALKPTVMTGLPHFLQTAHYGWLGALLIAGAAGGLLALVSGIPVLRLDQASAVIAILALVLIADIVFGAWVGVTNGGAGVYGLPPNTTDLARVRRRRGRRAACAAVQGLEDRAAAAGEPRGRARGGLLRACPCAATASGPGC